MVMNASSSSSSLKLYQLPDWWVTFIIFFSLILCSALISFTYQETHPHPGDLPQPHYLKYIEDTKPLYWAEFGKNSALLTEQRPVDGIKIELKNFRLEPNWPRDVSWHISTLYGGLLSIQFPPGRIKKLALFMVDGDSEIRISQIRTDGFIAAPAGLHNGKWLEIPLSAESQTKGSAEIRMTVLYGHDVSISALTAYEK